MHMPWTTLKWPMQYHKWGSESKDVQFCTINMKLDILAPNLSNVMVWCCCNLRHTYIVSVNGTTYDKVQSIKQLTRVLSHLAAAFLGFFSCLCSRGFHSVGKTSDNNCLHLVWPCLTMRSMWGSNNVPQNVHNALIVHPNLPSSSVQIWSLNHQLRDFVAIDED